MVARRGLGLITSSNFYVPQVNLPGSMATFVRPAAIPIAVARAKTGMGLRGLGQDSPVYAPSNITASWSDPVTGKPLAQDSSGTIWDLTTGQPMVSSVPSVVGPVPQGLPQIPSAGQAPAITTTQISTFLPWIIGGVVVVALAAAAGKRR